MNRRIGFWVVTAILCLGFLMSGVMNLFVRPAEIVETYVRLGYPTYVMTIIGAFKIAGVAVIVAPKLQRLKEWAYAGMVINMVGATASHLFAGDPVGTAVPTVLLLVLVLTSWALRPDDRKLSGPML